MIHIAIVDDDEGVSNNINEYIKKYFSDLGQKIYVTRYSDGDEIVENYNLDFDIIFMDIQMKFIDGMTAAKMIRKRDPDVAIIFITNMAQYAIKGYEVNAMDYILKPINYFSFSEKLSKALERIKSNKNHYLILPIDGGIIKVDTSKIYYIESQGRKLTFHKKDEKICTNNITMKEMEEQLTSYNFFRCNKGYLVNLEWVEGIKDGCAIIGSEKILISRAKKNMFLEALTNYLKKR